MKEERKRMANIRTHKRETPGQLGPSSPTPVEPATPEPATPDPVLERESHGGVKPAIRGWRMLIGILGAVAAGAIFVDTASTIASALASNVDLSAIQVMQIYTERIFALITVLVLVVSGYVFSRAGQ